MANESHEFPFMVTLLITSNNLENEKGRDGEKVKKKDGISMILVNYNDKN